MRNDTKTTHVGKENVHTVLPLVIQHNLLRGSFSTLIQRTQRSKTPGRWVTFSLPSRSGTRKERYLFPSLFLHHVVAEREVFRLWCFRTPTLGHRSAFLTWPSFMLPSLRHQQSAIRDGKTRMFIQSRVSRDEGKGQGVLPRSKWRYTTSFPRSPSNTDGSTYSHSRDEHRLYDISAIYECTNTT